MAFLGSLGKVFGITTPEAARIGAAFATQGIGAGIGTAISSLGDQPNIRTQQPIDVSAPPAGIDSPATVSQVSQTSQIMPPPISGAAEGFRGGFGTPNQAFVGGLGLPGLVGGAARLLSRPGVGGALTGFGAGAAVDFVVDMFGNQKKARNYSQAAARCEKGIYVSWRRCWVCVIQLNDAFWQKPEPRSNFDDFI